MVIAVYIAYDIDCYYIEEKKRHLSISNFHILKLESE